MFAVDEATADAIRRVYESSGELAAVVELRRHFPLFKNNEHARACVQSIELEAYSTQDAGKAIARWSPC